jgi:hypothetical protein
VSTDIDLLGHYVHPETLGHLREELVQRRDFHLARADEVDPKVLEMLVSHLHTSIQCFRCGRNVGINWNGKDGDPLTVGMVFLRPEEWEGEQRPSVVPDGTPCPNPTCEPITVRFTCKSGRVALANDLRECHTDKRKDEGRYHSICSHAGKVDHIKWYAERGYLTGYVGNTCVWFVPKDGGLDVVFPGDGIEDDEWERLDNESAHSVSTELWWFAIVDAADLPEGATDSYGREIGYMDLPPGEYEVVIQPETSTDPVVATLRPVGT